MSSAATMQQVKSEVAPKSAQALKQVAEPSRQGSAQEFSDQRPRVAAQRRLQDMANHSAQSKQLQALQQTTAQLRVDSLISTHQQNKDSNQLLQKMAQGSGTGGNGKAIQLYSYAAGSTKTITLKNAAATEQANIDVCTQNSVTYAAGDAKQAGTDTGVAAWAGWLTDAGTNNNATQLHVINQTLGGNGGASDGNIGPGSQNLNSHHLHQAEKFVKKELFDGTDKATHGFTFTCSFDYSNSVDKVHNTPTAKDTAIGDPAIKAKLTYAGTSPAVKTPGLTALESGVDVTNGKDMKFGKA